MKPQAMMMQMLMQQLQTRNPQLFKEINQAMNSGVNPQSFLKQVMGNISPQEMQNVMTHAQQFGVPNEVLQQIQNGINK